LNTGRKAKFRGLDEGCLTYLCSDEDPGIVLLPTHRVVLPAEPLWKKIRERCALKPCASRIVLEKALASAEGCVLGVAYENRFWLAKPARQIHRPAGPSGSRAGLEVDRLKTTFRIRTKRKKPSI